LSPGKAATARHATGERGVRAPYSRGTVFGLRKGLRIGTRGGKAGRLCGENHGGYRYYDAQGKRQSTRGLAWIAAHFTTRGGSQGNGAGLRPTHPSPAA